MSDERLIILTDEVANIPERPESARLTACPRCGAPASRAVVTSEFGGFRRRACQTCGNDYPPETI